MDQVEGGLGATPLRKLRQEVGHARVGLHGVRTLEKAARELKSAGYSLSVLAVGTRNGAPIPRASGGFVTDNRGQIALPRLEETGLRALSATGGGRFLRSCLRGGRR